MDIVHSFVNEQNKENEKFLLRAVSFIQLVGTSFLTFNRCSYMVKSITNNRTLYKFMHEFSNYWKSSQNRH